MNLKDSVTRQKDYLIKLRRDFHRHPEASWQETRTSKRIKTELNAAGLDFKEYAGTGVVATITGSKNVPDGKKLSTVALRADMDALAVTELRESDFKSENEGLMHACGHDGHTAMLLTAARILNSLRAEFYGTIKLIFQPAEEMVEGAAQLVAEGAVEDVDALLGIHLWSDLETGQINVEPGPRMASGDYVLVDFIGKGGHGSQPHQTIDPIPAAAAFALESQAVISREIDPLDPVVFTLGEIKSGSRFNIIPSRAHLEGTLRCFNERTRTAASRAIERYANQLAKSFRLDVKAEVKQGTPPTSNDPEIADLAATSAADVVGQVNLTKLAARTGSEDLAYYLKEVPGCLAFVGAGFADSEQNYPHHHPLFQINEASLLIGTELYLRFALDYLAK